jgi:CBS domain-containing protein
MENISSQCLYVGNTVQDAIEVTLDGRYRTSFVLDSHNKLLGVISEGDLIRAFKNNIRTNSDVISIMNPNPFFVYSKISKVDFLKLWVTKGIESVPVLDQTGSLLFVQNLRETIVVDLNPDGTLI